MNLTASLPEVQEEPSLPPSKMPTIERLTTETIEEQLGRIKEETAKRASLIQSQTNEIESSKCQFLSDYIHEQEQYIISQKKAIHQEKHKVLLESNKVFKGAGLLFEGSAEFADEHFVAAL
mmetsp:Transcript_30447/g.46635  ORF Transcript_30447/g.46635 Transcript_30447/m.46635 type:complete len:121 (+) Transcript_30447:319-681(+)